MAFIPSLRHYVLLNPTGLIRHAVLAGAAVGATRCRDAFRRCLASRKRRR